MENYNTLGSKILNEGNLEITRVGKTLALHNQSLSFDLTKSFPLMTTKYINHDHIIYETLWYLKGTTSIKYLKENNVPVWNKFADEHDDIGKTYSYQFRNFNGVDQVKEIISILNSQDKTTNRRAIINLYNVSDLKEMSIPPCIATIQFNAYYKDNKKFIDISVYQRSADFCLGVPYDIAEMALLSYIIATYTDSIPNNMTIFYSNIHVYTPHISTLLNQLGEDIPKSVPKLIIDTEKVKNSEPENLDPSYFRILGIPKNRKKYRYELF